jgi:hypothetical protein
VDLPQTLHGQLYLLAYDRKRHRFSAGSVVVFDANNFPLSGYAVRAAMLTDLYLTGHLEDKGGNPYPSSVNRPDDPVLRAAFHQIGVIGRNDWAQLITEKQGRCPQSRARCAPCCATRASPPHGPGTTTTTALTPTPDQPWPVRPDPFSTYRPASNPVSIA